MGNSSLKTALAALPTSLVDWGWRDDVGLGDPLGQFGIGSSERQPPHPDQKLRFWISRAVAVACWGKAETSLS